MPLVSEELEVVDPIARLALDTNDVLAGGHIPGFSLLATFSTVPGTSNLVHAIVKPQPVDLAAVPDLDLGNRSEVDQLTPGTPSVSDRKDFTDDVAVDVGEAIVAPAVPVRQSLVIEAHDVQDRRVQVVDVDFVFDGVPAKFIGGPVDASAAHASAGHPHGKPKGMVLAAVGPFGGRGASEFAAPEDERVFQQPADFISCSRAAIGWSTAAQRFGRFSRRPP